MNQKERRIYMIQELLREREHGLKPISRISSRNTDFPICIPEAFIHLKHWRSTGLNGDPAHGGTAGISYPARRNSCSSCKGCSRDDRKKHKRHLRMHQLWRSLCTIRNQKPLHLHRRGYWESGGRDGIRESNHVKSRHNHVNRVIFT